MKLRLGLVGLGRDWETRYRPALRALSDRFSVCAVYEQVHHRAQQAAAEFDASAVDGYRALTTRADVDAVLVLEHQWFGSLPILAACEARKSVYCATAMETDRDQARRIKQQVEESGIAFMAEFPCRYASATLRLKELIATALGAPQLVFCHHRAAADPQSADPGVGPRRNSSTQALVELVDWTCYVVDQRPTSVGGVTHRLGENAKDNTAEADYEVLSLAFAPADQPGTSAVAQVSFSRYLRPDWPEAIGFRPPADIQVCCERGVAFLDLPNTLVWFDEAGRHRESLDAERPLGELLLSQFHRAVTSLVRKIGSLEDAFTALTIVESGRLSQIEGRRVCLG